MSKRKLIAIVCFFCVINLLIAGRYARARWEHAALKITFLDVGQGDGAVLQTPSGRVLLIDTGGISEESGGDMGRRAVEPYLRSQGINHIDAIVLTHPHADHIGGADTLIRDFPTDLVIDNGEPTDPPLQQKIETDGAARHVRFEAALRGQSIDLGDGVRADILGPTAAEVAADKPNNASIVIKISYGSSQFLFMGDAEQPEEMDLLSQHIDLRCGYLKVGHHGSDTSSTLAFLRAVRPIEAIISVGRKNWYGHPSQLVIDRLKSVGARVDRTDVSGAVTCICDGFTTWIDTAVKPGSK